MKKNTSYLALAMAAAIALSSCSKKENSAENTEIARKEAMAAAPTNIKVKLNILGATQTYAEDATAISQVPELKDLKLYFVASKVAGEPIVKIEKGDINQITTGQTFQNIPGSADMIYIIANNSVAAIDSSALTTQAQVKADLDKITFDVSHQGNFISAVNLVGNGAITVVTGAPSTATIDIQPAAARIEIDQISAKTGTPHELSSFDLSGIFINKTFTKFGSLTNVVGTADVDHTTPTDFDANGVFTTTHSAFCDILTGKGKAAYVPTKSSATTWAYYVAPAATPSVILKIDNAIEKAAANNGVTYGANQYITITKFQDAQGKAITTFDPAKVYHIDNIAFDGNNLAPLPNTPSVVDVIATVTIKPWTEAKTTVVL